MEEDSSNEIGVIPIDKLLFSSKKSSQNAMQAILGKKVKKVKKEKTPMPPGCSYCIRCRKGTKDVPGKVSYVRSKNGKVRKITVCVECKINKNGFISAEAAELVKDKIQDAPDTDDKKKLKKIRFGPDEIFNFDDEDY